jgi:hypothetical protein
MSGPGVEVEEGEWESEGDGSGLGGWVRRISGGGDGQGEDKFEGTELNGELEPSERSRKVAMLMGRAEDEEGATG